jgi:hypothetical protein
VGPSQAHQKPILKKEGAWVALHARKGVSVELAKCLKNMKFQLMASKPRIELEKRAKNLPVFPFCAM